jgi:hypothetical protein
MDKITDLGDFTPRQSAVYLSLLRKNSELAELYRCALRALRDVGNPGRIFLAAHAVREMMNQLPDVMDVPAPRSGDLGNKFNDILPTWQRAIAGGCYATGQWLGAIDEPLRGFLRRLQTVIEWWQESHRSHREAAAVLFRRMDPAFLPLPEQLEGLRINRWLDLRRYFNNTAHREGTSDGDFESKLGVLEQMLIDGLYRSPSADFLRIDEILGEEDDAKG